MNNANQKSLNAIHALALDDIDAASDDEICAEIVEAGEDPDAVALRVAANLDEVVSQFLRDQTASRKAVMSTVALRAPAWRPSLDIVKKLVQGAFTRDPELAAAFREGSKQSDNDLLSLYDDLVSMGKIESPEDAD